MTRALILDCDGVLADTERDGHRVAFNETFQELGIPLQWSEEDYAALVRIGGGKERMRSALTPQVLEQLGIADDPETIRRALAGWHQVKTGRYVAILASGRLPARPGVPRLIGAALDAGWKVAIASTSAKDAVDAVLAHAVGEATSRRVQVFAGDVVPHKKPAPDIYLHALSALDIAPTEAVVIEDSGVGCAAAVAAGLPTIVTVSGYTGEDDFIQAALVMSDLGEPDAPARVVANPYRITVDGLVDMGVLDAVRAAANAPANPR